MKKIQLLLGATVLLAPITATAATLSNSFASWSATVTSPYLEDFNAVVQDVSFNNAAITYGGMTFSVSAPGFNATGNMIDALPHDFGGTLQADGTSYVMADILTAQSLTIDFGSDLSGFGATFVGLANGARVETIRLLAADNSVIDSFAFTGLGVSDKIFVGLTSPAAFRKLSFTMSLSAAGPINDTFGIDNVWRASSVAGAVPEASTWGMMIMGLGMAGAALRTRRRKALVA